MSRGYTLIETLVAFTLILIVITGPITLISRGLVGLSNAKNKLIAANLAQEAVEIARAIRENNILCDQLNEGAAIDWLQDPSTPGVKITSTAREVDVNRTVVISCAPGGSITTPLLNVSSGDTLRFDPTTGRYGYTGAQSTPFVRTVTIVSPPAILDPDTNVPAADQADIIATVSWQERGVNRSITLRERLYNWR